MTQRSINWHTARLFLWIADGKKRSVTVWDESFFGKAGRVGGHRLLVEKVYCFVGSTCAAIRKTLPYHHKNAVKFFEEGETSFKKFLIKNKNLTLRHICDTIIKDQKRGRIKV